MKGGDICPFYGKSDDLCDVGCVYISPHDVSVIIKYCSSHYGECAKFQELAERFPELVDSDKPMVANMGGQRHPS